MANPLIIPRPGTTFDPRPPIPGPSEQEFTSTFGTLLPPAHFLTTPIGTAAYYILPRPSPSSSSSSPPSSSAAKPQPSNPPPRVLLIHGVQTPALGMFPLACSLRDKFPATSFALVDLWGHGLSDTPVRPHEGALFHGLIDAVLDALGWADVHVVGFSFGAVLTMGYVGDFLGGEGEGEGEQEKRRRRERVKSYALVAPAGLVRKAWFTEEQRGWLGAGCKLQDEEKAAEWVESVLEGGERKVPLDWRASVADGRVVAEALREWQVENHAGHPATVTAVFRDGGVTDNDELFVRAKGTGVPSLVVLGADDDLSTEEEIRGFGFDVRVVPQAGHGVVREKAGDVAGHIAEFWNRL